MRHFPRTARRRMVSAALAATMAVGVSTIPSAYADDLKDKQRKVQKDIKSAQSELHASSRSMQRATAKLAAARDQLAGAQVALAAAEGKAADAAVRDAQMQVELDEATAALEQAQTDLALGRGLMNDQLDQVTATVTDFYQQGDPQLLAFASLLDSQTPADLTRQNELRDGIVDREARVFQELQAAKVLLKMREQQVEDAKEAVALKRQAAADHLVVMQSLEAEAAAAKASVVSLVGARATAQSAAVRAKRADEAALAELEQEEAKISDMLRRRALAALRAQRAKQRDQGPASPGNSGGFLDSPVSGTLSSPYGYRSHPIYGYWGLHDGQDWAAGCGQPLYAGADGRVVSSYSSTVYGRRLVVDHGAVSGVGLATIYNHATSYTVGVGARVTRGQVIGYVGDSGWSTGCHLHFTVMANGSTVDPRNWL
ncbi:M23 family metallopeptidase [Nocardioides sp. 616]|uniref:M23 family metallopeptidase n=1 Tax=Nocardioides sp. 616 TaxID=2268090 RepID=UPI0013B36B8E|nr:M23 family metallopeptidase [Nocardioides sp. 616]